jgi:hypothetical protein
VGARDWTVEALTVRIVAIDPTGPVLESAAALRQLHRELVEDLGDREARERFDRALGRALPRCLALRGALRAV